MPRKRKTGGSPSQKNGNSDRTAVAVSQGDPSHLVAQAMHYVNKEELLNRMSEMFSDLDPSVVYMVLSECDFKVENAMDHLLELSTHAKGVVSSKTFGFDLAASLPLVNQQRAIADERTGEGTATHSYSGAAMGEVLSPGVQLTGELDSLLETAFQSYSLSEELPNSANDQIVPEHPVEHDGFTEFPEGEKSDSVCSVLLFPQQGETNKEVLENFCFSQPPVSQLCIQTSSPSASDSFAQVLEDSDLLETHIEHDVASEVYKLSNGEVLCENSDQTRGTVLDQSSVTAASCGSSQRSVEHGVAVTGDPTSRCLEQHRDAVTAFSSQQSASLPEACISPETSSFKIQRPADTQQTQQGYNLNFSTPSGQSQQQWNLMAPVFYPSSGSNSFVIPVAASPGQWRPVSDCRTSEKGLFLSFPVVSNAWDGSPSLKVWGNQDRNSKLNLSQAQQPRVCHMMRKKMQLIGQVLVLLRGVPGSGKSYLARNLLEDNPGGIILSTDDYFYKHGQYHYDPDCLGEAHDWNRKRAKEAFERRISPIIIDNTNIQAWEMKPYVALAQQFKYKVMFREPDTWWKFNPKELERRNIHGVSKEKIKRMLERYERCLTVRCILDSSVPDKSEAAGWSEEDPCQEESQRNREAHSDVKEEGFASEVEPIELAEVDKSPSISLTLESSCDAEHFQKEEKEMEDNSVEHNSENSTVQDVLEINLSDYIKKELPLEKKEEKGLITEKNTEAKIDEVDLIPAEETVNLHTGGAEEHSDNNSLKVQTAVEQLGKICMEPKSTQTSNTVEPSSMAFGASGKPELLNFLGDWPVEQTMGQRVKKPRRLEKSPLKSDEEGETPSQQHSEIGREQVSLPETYTVEKGREDENLPCSCYSVSSDEVTPELQMLGYWPVSASLEQRQQRSRRMRKTNLNQCDEDRSTEDDTDMNALETVHMIHGSPVNTEEQPDTRSLPVHQEEIVASEIVSGEKSQQSKRARKHHKLALTFTNSSLPHPIEEDHLSQLNMAEEKQDTNFCRQKSSHSQTESQDFALLWRLENKMLFPETTKVLHGRLDGFKPKDIDNASDSQEKIPYRVTYDKSTFVEESELINIDESEKLHTLCKLFESVSFEALKDLYERCNKDIDWATGLLLDSDEKLRKAVDTESFQVSEAEPVVKASTDYDENLKDCKQTPQVLGAGDTFEGLEGKNSSLSIAESRAAKTAVTSADSFTATSLDNSVELKNSVDSAPRADASNSAAGVIELSFSGEQKGESESPPEETVNKPSLSELDAGLPHDPNTTSTNLKSELNNESDSNPSESNAESSKGTGLLLEMDCAPLVHPRSNKELEMDKETQENSREICGKEEIETPSWAATKVKRQSPVPASHAAFSIDCLELTLPPELALQLKEIFGPVGIDAGSLTVEDCVVHIDLNLAKVIHEKWKESILKRQRRDESCKLSAEVMQQIDTDDSEALLSQNEDSRIQQKKSSSAADTSNDIQTKTPATSDVFPFMDHWNAQIQKVSLRQIISEEIAMQEREDLNRVPSTARKDCAAKLKEKQLFEMFPTINQNFLMDVFRDNNYSLEQTEQFLNCVLEADPVKTVIAQECVQQNEIVSSYSAAKNREKKAKKSKEEDDPLCEMFQDFEYPQYEDLRAEAFCHQQKRQECLKKAGEAYRMGMKPVAAFYAHQGRLHEQKMKEANHAAAVQIFERVNTSLLPMNVLDLHGLHVDEAVNQLSRVLQEKSEEYQQTGGKPYLSVITGRGSHSQGGVARIRPAAIRYLTSHNFRFTEIKPGCLKVMLN
ncbi:NEDD4-binding protein 2 [Hirundo rustica]|uniref:NEDD4-binding protein 2 n=1 Tax=Hirundo rustica TaxID=43150 RepID=UPI001A941F7B|nr:NEDD4-binding protein 2 [Hirundo rustica]XP_039920098.1 NEDD4-binding protein 2 [Hirundo rustica]XP_039920099.1 NEDD4-binding protein 2 [Hirundo rustica]XP_039920100.1 NEDD4-binding protein 2 [Hirundo rustica]XP_039920101.1 NEDD4-binding protein 2 [Hirundo rustica]XP_039920102.1 NEDD4-binding protein 2 [Hirundo rustica]XP_039920103.1 NEDD4-binding protein 2 [Hirundo rustica]XP_039920105.1 NEDD4-binding protein 2 [Hirundo rustica]XP_039920106.1 NEDD4-binding protein 2 [Hirundo rustica]XP